MSQSNNIVPFPQKPASGYPTNADPSGPHKKDIRPHARFDRRELSMILDLYGRKVAAGEWRDYAIDMGRDTATFSIFRRTSESPLLRIEKTPMLARKQGAYCIVAATGHILKRGHDLKNVLRVLDKRIRLVKS